MPLEAAPHAEPSAADLPGDDTAPSRLRIELATIAVLVRRDLVRFFRQRSRVVGALLQPLLFWLAIGAGFDPSFRMPAGSANVPYLQYFFPGIIVLVVLFTAIFSTLSVIEDRHQGFLQAVLVAPASRAALVLGKTLGGVSVALVQAAMFALLAPLAGFPLAGVAWAYLALFLVAIAVALSALGFAVAWWLDSVQGYHAIMVVGLVPVWVVSGAMFTATGGAPVMRALVRWNPVAYAVAGVRRALYGGAGTAGLGCSSALEIAVVVGFALAMLGLAAWLARFARVPSPRRPRGREGRA